MIIRTMTSAIVQDRDHWTQNIERLVDVRQCYRVARNRGAQQ